MTNEEADVIAKIIATSDSGCSVCVRSGTGYLMRHFPDHDWKKKLKKIAARKNEYWLKEIDEWEESDDSQEQYL